jgi:hypothetical protein
MKQIKKTILVLASITLISGCVENSSTLTTALSDGLQAGVKTSMDQNESTTLKPALIDGVQVGLKSALDDNSTKDKNGSASMTSQLIDGVANHLKEKKE